MWLENFKLIKKEKLTHDIFELVFELWHNVVMKPWQFITFILPKIWGRAYSILESNDNKIKLIIKRREEGRWWSKFICDLKLWDILTWVWAAWHFTLRESSKNKLFFWTWTWFVPLYNQILWNIENKIENKIKLIFWVRTQKDLFYISELENLKQNNSNFDFEIYLSSEKSENYNNWYITEFLTPENLENFQEFYICWAPAMIDSSVEILEKNWKENIFFEKY